MAFPPHEHATDGRCDAIDCFAHGLAHLMRSLGPADALTCAAKVILQVSELEGGALTHAADHSHARTPSRVACRRTGS